MAHYKRKRARIRTSRGKLDRERRERAEKTVQGWLWYRSTPSAWNIQFHVRPMRRETRVLERSILRGADPDSIAWPVARKPHIYYW